jgi:hypothetical protein
MSRTIHDEFAKDWMQEFLSDFGTVQTEFQISSEVRHVDVHFEPAANCLPVPMGILGRMVAATCLIEPFRNAISGQEICNCNAKSTLLGYSLINQAKRDDRPFRFDDRPFLWMISPTLSRRMQQRCCLHPHPHWGKGIYFRPESDRSGVVVVHQLPTTPETLWLRLLGRGKVQQQAIAELLALPPNYPYREISLRHIAVLQQNLKARQNLDSDLEDVIMALSITYEQIEAEILQKGREEGRKEALSITYEQIESEILQKGREEGREEGEIQEKLSIARNMLNEGITLEMIGRVTGLTEAQLDILVRGVDG